MIHSAQSDQPISYYLAKKDATVGEALRLFRGGGYDTLDIARIMRITEAVAHRLASTGISHSKRRKAIFVPHGELA